jgi:hypothetical protein
MANFINNLKKVLDEKKLAIVEKQRELITTKEIQEERISICNDCEELFHFTRQCKECSCFVDAKTRLSSSFCPLNKW